jgi:glutathione S-transferase
MGGLGPMQGQANHFFRYAPEKIQYGIDRYQAETKRLYSVLNNHLEKQPSGYLVGDKLTIADIANYGWVRSHAWAGVEIDEFPALKAWEEKISAREGVQRGLQAPPGTDAKKKLTEEEVEARLAEARQWIKAPESSKKE